MEATHDDHDSWLHATVQQHQAALTRYAAHLLRDPDRARDVVQDTFVRLMAQSRAELDGHVVEWLFTVCRHRALDVARKEGRMKSLADHEAEHVPATEPRPGRTLEQAETQSALLALIDHLPPNQQEVIRLKFQQGFSYKEISRITQLSVTNVGFLIHTAVTRLRREFAAQQP